MRNIDIHRILDLLTTLESNYEKRLQIIKKAKKDLKYALYCNALPDLTSNEVIDYISSVNKVYCAFTHKSMYWWEQDRNIFWSIENRYAGGGSDDPQDWKEDSIITKDKYE